MKDAIRSLLLSTHPHSEEETSILRPYLQLEITESKLLQNETNKSIQSLYAEVAKEPPEIESFACAGLESIASEKFVSLLRRTALAVRDSFKYDDETLIRHVYDLHLIEQSNADFDLIVSLISKVIKIDLEQFGKEHPEFQKRPVQELKFGFENIKNNALYK